MSRKRILKKHQKKQDTLLARLGELYRQGASDEFLLLAEQLPDPAASPVAAEWTEVAERAVRESLAGGDLGRLSRLVRPLRRSGRLRPLAVLAEAVLDLAEGRLEAARGRLAELAGKSGGDAGPVPRDLLPALQALAREEPDLRPQPSAAKRREEPYLGAVSKLFAALKSLEAGACALAPEERRGLARHLAAVRSAVPAELAEPAQRAQNTELHRLLSDAGLSLSLLADLSTLVSKGQATSREVAGWLRGAGSPLAAAFGRSTPPLLAPLRHALHLRWRAVLEGVAAREGSSGLAALWTAAPDLIAHDVALPRSAAVREADQARQLLAERRYDDLARLLRSRHRTVFAVSDPGELAALWSLELWAIGESPKEDGGEPPPHRTIVRLHQMAGEIGQRFPPDLRAEVAGVLRDGLFEACRKAHFCDHVGWAALSLLEHLPDDAGLLVAGVAGAVVDEDPKSFRALEARLARRVRVQVEIRPRDLEACRQLMFEISREGPWDLAPILVRLRPLFAGDAWPGIAALVAQEMAGSFGRTLQEESFEDGGDISLTRSALDGLRPLLGGTAGFAAVEVVVECWQPDRRVTEKRLAKFFAAFPGLDAPLAAFQMLDKALMPESPPGAQALLDRLARAVIDRLDERWQLWSPEVAMLAASVDAREKRRLETKIRQLLATGELPKEGREALEHTLQAIRRLEELRRTLKRQRRNSRRSLSPEPREPAPSKRKPRTQESDTPQLQLDL